MKNGFLIIAFILISLVGTSQTDSVKTPTIVEVMPTYPGGDEARMKFIQSNLKYPEKERKKGITGKCVITFVVEKDGSISGVRVREGIKNGKGLEEEAKRVVKLMPNWNPGMQDGKSVRVQFNMPLVFKLRT